MPLDGSHLTDTAWRLIAEFPTMDAFAEWLRSHNPNDIVGVRLRLHSCPLAVYLNDLTGTENAYVRPDKIAEESCWRVSEDGSQRQPLPEWANRFATAIDCTESDEAIKATLALDVLAVIAAECGSSAARGPGDDGR